MRIDGTRYSTKYLRTIRAMRKNFGIYIVGCYMAGGKVPASHAMCLLNMR